MELITIDQTMLDVIEHPENYEVDVCAAAFGLLKDISRKVYDLQKNVEYRIIMDMDRTPRGTGRIIRGMVRIRHGSLPVFAVSSRMPARYGPSWILTVSRKLDFLWDNTGWW